MEALSIRVGRRIRSFRKVRGMSVAQLSRRIGRSEATLYKYESGQIPPDVNTIQLIAQALQIEPAFLFDIPEGSKSVVTRIRFLDGGRFYAYYHDGRINALVKSLLVFYPAPEGNENRASFYMNLQDFDDPERSRYIYTGERVSHETVSYFIMENLTLPIETFVIQMVHPMQTSQTTWGLFMGLSDQPMAPMATKMLFSRVPLSARQLADYPLEFTKEELRNIRSKNALLLSIRESEDRGLR